MDMGSLKALSRYWHTLRYLRPVQIYGRALFRLARPRPDQSPAPRMRRVSGPWVVPAARLPSLTGPDGFLFLEEAGNLTVNGWDDLAKPKLWRYNQHYFDDLNAERAEERHGWHVALMNRWVLDNAVGKGSGWEPYPTSLRVVNWIKWAAAGNELPPICVQSLAVQVRWLKQRLEVHLLGNHLLANAKALLFAGLFFEGPEAQRWLDASFRILSTELPEQVLPDGGHFERSTMYHALALEDMLDLCNLLARHAGALSNAQRALAADWPERARSMIGWLHSMCHPDGEISFFNDAAFGIAPSRYELDRYAQRLGLTPEGAPEARWLDVSGYARLQTACAVALLDMAPIGPDYLPGHAHADTLSFELSVHKQRLLVNSGTSCYGTGLERLRQRGTSAHNTVVVNGEDSSEVWAGFRVARRAYPLAATVTIGPEAQTARCSHDGYTRLRGRPIHERQWDMWAGGIQITDRIRGAYRTAQARFHFHPDVQLEAGENALTGQVLLPGGQKVNWKVKAGTASIFATTWHPRFGEPVPNKCLAVELANGVSLLLLTWSV